MSTEQTAGKVAQDIATTAGGGILLAFMTGFLVWGRKLISLPRRVRVLEQTDAIVIRSMSSTSRYLLASNSHRSESDKSPEMIEAEKALRADVEAMDNHLIQIATGGKQ